jgi:hypothetical protein
MKPARKHQHTHLRAVHALANAAANPRANTRLAILSIDAWADGDGGWTWNGWRCVGYVDCATFEAAGRNPRALLRFMREQGFLSLSSAGLCAVDDDQHNLVIVGRRTREPMFAIEYAPAYN